MSDPSRSSRHRPAPLLAAEERAAAEAIARLAYCNPFVPQRVELERQALGARFVGQGVVWHRDAAPGAENPNVDSLDEIARQFADELRRRLVAGAEAGDDELEVYRDLVLYHLYQRCEGELYQVIEGEEAAAAAALASASGASPPAPRGRPRGRRMPVFNRFAEEVEHFFQLPGRRLPPVGEAPHLFACFFQLRRAFHFTFHYILGGSMPAARLRSAVWQSIFSHDMGRYQRSLYAVLGELTTLVTGPSGTGKELVARAIGLSRYLPFDPEAGGFAEDFAAGFFPLNLSALSPTLIESELFGHRRGAFTGAVEDRAGWLEVCPPLGTVFLDEIGEVEPAIQVKLLRVLENRTFQRLGETAPRRFAGKLVAATNRDLAEEMHEGRFRRDLYYRLCADVVDTPSLAERLADSPGELDDLVFFLARRLVGEGEAAALAGEVVEWVDAHLGREYPWPGNVRELDQCVRNVLLRRSYRPAAAPRRDPAAELGRQVAAGALSDDELVRRYATLVYHRAGSFQEAARRLGIDRRTVKARLDRQLLAALAGGG